MDTKLALRLIDEIEEKKIAKLLYPSIMGEPTLHPDFIKIIEHIKKNTGLNINIITNGSGLNDELNDVLLSDRVKTIGISFRAVTKEMFDKHNVPLSFDEYKEKIKKLIKLKMEKKVQTEIELRVFKDTFYSKLFSKDQGYDPYINMESIKEIGQEIRDYCGDTGEIKELRSNFFSINDYVSILPGVSFKFNNLSVWDSANLKQKTFYEAKIGACDGLQRQFGIYWNGDVTTCCRDYDGKNVLGNVANSSILEVLNNQKAVFIRDALIRMRMPTEFCRRCKGGPLL